MGLFGGLFGRLFGNLFGDTDTGGAPAPTPGTGPDGWIIPWPPVDAVQHTRAWATDVLKSLDGTERRIATRAIPRETWAATFELTDPELRVLRARLFADPPLPCLLPLHHEGLLITADVASTVLTCSTVLADWCTAGQRVVIVNDAGEQDQAVIQSAGAGSITVYPAPSYDHRGGLAYVYPLRAVYLEDRQSVGRLGVGLGTWQLRARQALPWDPTPVGVPTFTEVDGVIVLDIEPLSRDEIQETHSKRLVPVDFGGAVEVFTDQTYTDIGRAHSYRIFGATERQWWKAFLLAVRGQQVSFFLPTWRDDLVILDQLTATTFAVAQPPGAEVGSYPDDWFPSLAHRYVMLVTDAGVVHYRKITAAVAGVGQDVITVASVTGDVPTRAILLERVRLASDEVPMFYSPGRALIQLAMVTTQDPLP